ncbi:lysosomal alpha-mannosidase-like [Dysidea avara]|uniref:lysosomal alpha-mannosidase-like n=1 Tax=Dysidea avara TaxID=196820 RepID=UPI003328B9AA
MVLSRVCLVLGLFSLVQCERLNVHLIPHTHDDVGWLKTVDQYYYGANNTIQDAGVQYILDTVVKELTKNTERTFIYVEMAFFTRWWKEQNNDTKSLVKQLVENGQLEFTNGGWCMNDEGATHYNAIIDQMTEGLRFITDTFGAQYRPRVAWQIDTFGHSSEQASLFAMMGFDGLFFARLDYGDKNTRLDKKTMEMVWRGSSSLNEDTQIFTGVLYHHYTPPDGFCFDQKCSDPPIQDDKDLFDYNVEERVNDFIKVCLDQAQYYRTNNIMLTMGSDFQYENANMWFKNLDKLIHHVNKNDSVNVFYSTPSRYIDAVYKANLTWSVKLDDFFPYGSAPWSYWTGYFTSRPALKGYVRYNNALLQVGKQIEAMHGGFYDNNPSCDRLAKAMAVAQHHDAVSGTEKQHVANDYAKRLHIGQVECEGVISQTISDMIKRYNGSSTLSLETCEYLNVSVCPASTDSNEQFDIIVYNPRGYTDDKVVVRVPISSPNVTVQDSTKNITCQVLPVPKSTMHVRGDRGKAQYTVVFIATVPPLGYNTYFVRPSDTSSTVQCVFSEPTPITSDTVVQNTMYEVMINGSSGHLAQVINKLSEVKVRLDQQFFWYWASDGHNANSSQTSNAYVFRPNSSNVYDINENDNFAIASLLKGPVVQEVWQDFGTYVGQQIRLYETVEYIELEYTIGPLPQSDKKGKEVISYYDTDLSTMKQWYTDANGREMQLRNLGGRQTWVWNNTAPIAGNYYPINSRIFIRDETAKSQVTVLTDRSHGGSSLRDGSLEIMVHRRLLNDDSVGEHLNETGQFGDGLIVRGTNLLVVDTIENSARIHRSVGEEMLLPAMMIFHRSTITPEEYVQSYNTEYKGLATELPANVRLLTLQYVTDTEILLRLEHQYEVREDKTLSVPATVNIEDLFTNFVINSCDELILGGNENLSNVDRLKWRTLPTDESDQYKGSKKVVNHLQDDLSVTLNPMEIRTFQCQITRNTL